MRFSDGRFLFLALLLWVWPAAAGWAAGGAEARQTFLDAEQALRDGDLIRYRALAGRLRDDPLYPYLEFQRLSRQLDDDAGVRRFLAEQDGSWLAERLRKRYLFHLAKAGRHRDFLALYQPGDGVKLHCLALRARLATDRARFPWQEAIDLWLTGRTRPPVCSPLFDRLYASGRITPELLWQRIELAMARRNLRLARFLARKLPDAQRADFRRWLQMDKKPAATLAAARAWPDTPRNRAIVLHGLKRLARQDTVEAWRQWRTVFADRFAFSEDQRHDIERSLVLRAAWRHMPQAVEWFAQVPEAALDREARAWRIRSALRIGDWGEVLAGIDALPDEEADDEQWRYWRARALLEVPGGRDEGRRALAELARNTSYYGFLAADRLGRDYTFTDEPVVDEGAARAVRALARRPVFRRIRALYELGRTGEAYGEWMHEIARLSDHDKRLAARLAHEWGWHFTAIVTTARARHFSDLSLRFPLAYKQPVLRHARSRDLPPSFVLGVVRRESAFKEDARSPAGALGLMQLMPATARHVSRQLGIGRPSRADLQRADSNILLGTSYLRELLDRFQGHEVLATAGYNAGPHRVRRWLPEEGPLAADVWVDTIPFDETRKYVRAVLFYSTVFDWKLDERVDRRLLARMRPVPPATALQVAAR